MNIRVWRRPAENSISKPLLTVTKLKGDARDATVSLKPITDSDGQGVNKRVKLPKNNSTLAFKMADGDFVRIGDSIIVEVEKRFGRQTRLIFSVPKEIPIELSNA